MIEGLHLTSVSPSLCAKDRAHGPFPHKLKSSILRADLTRIHREKTGPRPRGPVGVGLWPNTCCGRCRCRAELPCHKHLTTKPVKTGRRLCEKHRKPGNEDLPAYLPSLDKTVHLDRRPDGRSDISVSGITNLEIARIRWPSSHSSCVVLPSRHKNDRGENKKQVLT